MNARTVFTILLLLFGAVTMGVAAADIVVLTTGERLDVETYELKGSMVIVKTWDGRFRSLPDAYVDLEATAAANAGTTIEQRLAPERLDKARLACDAYGMGSRVGSYWEIFESELGKLRGQVSYAVYEQLRASFRNAFDDERSFDAVVSDFARNANVGLLDSWTTWLHEPATQRMLELETLDMDTQEANQASRFYVELRSDPRDVRTAK